MSSSSRRCGAGSQRYAKSRPVTILRPFLAAGAALGAILGLGAILCEDFAPRPAPHLEPQESPTISNFVTFWLAPIVSMCFALNSAQSL